MAKSLNKNRLLLIISAVLIVIALIITIVATIYEKNAGKAQPPADSTNAITTTEPDETKKATDETNPPKAPDTTNVETTTPIVSTGKTGKYTIATQNDPLGIRLNASTNTTTVGAIPKGTEIEILAVYEDWGYVNYQGTGGWVPMKYVKFVSASETQQKYSTGKYKVTESGNLSIRIKAETGAPTDGSIPSGTEIEVISVCGDWGYMKHQDKMGWLPFESLKKVS